MSAAHREPEASVAWTSTRRAWIPAVACVVSSAAVATVLLAACGVLGRRLVVAAAVVVLVASVMATATSRVCVSVNSHEVGYQAGWGRWHHISFADIQTAACVNVDSLSVIGLGLSAPRYHSRHVVGSGPALSLSLKTGRQVWLSTTAGCPLATFLRTPTTDTPPISSTGALL